MSLSLWPLALWSLGGVQRGSPHHRGHDRKARTHGLPATVSVPYGRDRWAARPAPEASGQGFRVNERERRLDSDVFDQKFHRGERGDEETLLRWATMVEMRRRATEVMPKLSDLS